MAGHDHQEENTATASLQHPSPVKSSSIYGEKYSDLLNDLPSPRSRRLNSPLVRRNSGREMVVPRRRRASIRFGVFGLLTGRYVVLAVAVEVAEREGAHMVDEETVLGAWWPTLLEALSTRPGGPPPLVRLTVVPSENRQIPFANCPPGYDFTSNILRFAKGVNINLQINTLDNGPLQNLNTQIINSPPDETLIVCA
ncbi:hypothetical protein L1887_28777 [Cichorium endivia]|nr:hypothetical protein L1887_28777 [Cichorium endivia]